MGIVGNSDDNSTVVAILLSILGAVVLGAGMTLAVTFHVRKKMKGGKF